MKLEWRKISGIAGYDLYLGKEFCGSVIRRTQHLNLGDFRARSKLTARCRDDFKTLKEGKEWVEQCVREWVASAGLTGGENDQKA